MPDTDAQFPEKLQCLFLPKRFKVLWGGRGAGRSWGIARALLIQGAKQPLTVLCAREFQNSIAESVHKVLASQIDLMGLGEIYKIQDKVIYSRDGVLNGTTSFHFEGIKNNVDRIKSYEGINICWVEEANKVSQDSWEKLIPTIRTKGSEIWISFNPDLEKDYTYQRFVAQHNPERAYCVHMTYKDNPWFLETELEAERLEMQRLDPDAYLNVWEGRPRTNLEGAVFAKQLRDARMEERIGVVSVDRTVPVDTFWDLGRRDLTSIWFAQRVGLQWRVVDFYEARQYDLHHYLQVCQSKPYVYGTFYLPHDAKAKRLGEKKTIEEIIRGNGKTTRVVPRTSKKGNAISAARVMFPNCWFDERKCAVGLSRLGEYKFQIKDGQWSDEPLHDDASNAADAFMTLAQAIQSGTKSDPESFMKRLFGGFSDDSMLADAGGQDWMAR